MKNSQWIVYLQYIILFYTLARTRIYIYKLRYKGLFVFPGGFVLADGFFLIFIFEWKGWFRSAGAFLGFISLPSFHCFRLRSFSTGFLASLRGRRRALGFLPLPRLRIRLAKSNAKDGFRVLGFLVSVGGRLARRGG